MRRKSTKKNERTDHEIQHSVSRKYFCYSLSILILLEDIFLLVWMKNNKYLFKKKDSTNANVPQLRTIKLKIMYSQVPNKRVYSISIFPHPTRTFSTLLDLQIFHPTCLLGTFF